MSALKGQYFKFVKDWAVDDILFKDTGRLQSMGLQRVGHD